MIFCPKVVCAQGPPSSSRDVQSVHMQALQPSISGISFFPYIFRATDNDRKEKRKRKKNYGRNGNKIKTPVLSIP